MKELSNQSLRATLKPTAYTSVEVHYKASETLFVTSA